VECGIIGAYSMWNARTDGCMLLASWYSLVCMWSSMVTSVWGAGVGLYLTGRCAAAVLWAGFTCFV
jgi:hypothetical protein